MSKAFSQKLHKLYINLGGHAVVITGGTVEFVDEFPDPNVAFDTLAGALWVEGNQNAESFPELSHSEEIDGQHVTVTYGLNASRHFTQPLASDAVNKGVVAGGPDRPIGMNNPDGFVDGDPKGLNTPEAFSRSRVGGPNVVEKAQTAEGKALDSFSNPSEVENVPNPPKPAVGPVSEPFNPDEPEKGVNPNTVNPNSPPVEHTGAFGETPGETARRVEKVKDGGGSSPDANPNTVNPNSPEVDHIPGFSETPSEAKSREEKVAHGGKAKIK